MLTVWSLTTVVVPVDVDISMSIDSATLPPDSPAALWVIFMSEVGSSAIGASDEVKTSYSSNPRSSLSDNVF